MGMCFLFILMCVCLGGEGYIRSLGNFVHQRDHAACVRLHLLRGKTPWEIQQRVKTCTHTEWSMWRHNTKQPEPA